jgi:hypothetical protein
MVRLGPYLVRGRQEAYKLLLSRKELQVGMRHLYPPTLVTPLPLLL